MLAALPVQQPKMESCINGDKANVQNAKLLMGIYLLLNYQPMIFTDLQALH